MKNAEQDNTGRKMHINTALCIFTVGLALSAQILRQKGITDIHLDLTKTLTLTSSFLTFISSRGRAFYYNQLTPGMLDYEKVPSVRRKEFLISALTALSGLSQVFQ